MAGQNTLDYGAASGSDYAQHEATYLSFVRLIKWVVAANLIVLFLMAYLLV